MRTVGKGLCDERGQDWEAVEQAWGRDSGGHWRFPESSPWKGPPDCPTQTQCTTRQSMRLGAGQRENPRKDW